MSQQGDVEYKLMNSEGVELTTSKAYSGMGITDYPNGDKYQGIYENGVKQFHYS